MLSFQLKLFVQIAAFFLVNTASCGFRDLALFVFFLILHLLDLFAVGTVLLTQLVGVNILGDQPLQYFLLFLDVVSEYG